MTKDIFWDRMESINAGMLDVTVGKRLVPMSHYADPAANALWFMSARGTDVVDAVAAGPRDSAYVLADGGKGLFAHVTGSLSISTDRAKLEDLWNPVADAWFEGGIDDPDLTLLCFAITGAEVWVTPTSGLRFMFNVAKAQLTGTQPDMGDHFTL
ncbi:MAG: pyridoxamine 5'-phosphate oxidase family protein [Pseudomonadota bacterium]